MLLLLPAEPRHSRLEELRSRERKHEHIAHPSAIGACLEEEHNRARK